MRVLICGGREFNDWDFLNDTLYDIFNEIGLGASKLVIIHGGARGADSLAGRFAKEYGIEVEEYPVTKEEWKTLGKGAGHIRNAKMLHNGNPSLVIAFPGGNGTRNMVDIARKAGVTVKEIEYGND